MGSKGMRGTLLAVVVVATAQGLATVQLLGQAQDPELTRGRRQADNSLRAAVVGSQNDQTDQAAKEEAAKEPAGNSAMNNVKRHDSTNMLQQNPPRRELFTSPVSGQWLEVHEAKLRKIVVTLAGEEMAKEVEAKVAGRSLTARIEFMTNYIQNLVEARPTMPGD